MSPNAATIDEATAANDDDQATPRALDVDVPHIEDAARVFLCVKSIARSSTIGFATFDRDANAMYLTQGYVDDDDELLQLVMTSTFADVIYCTSHVKTAVDAILAQASTSAAVVVVGEKHFPSRADAVDALCALGGFVDRDVLGTCVNLREECALSAAGALTRVLCLNAAISLELHGTPVRIEELVLERITHIDNETLCAIGVFVPANCRRVSASCGVFEEDVFELFVKHVTTKGGSRLLEQWFRRPLRRLDVIGERQDCVEHFMRSGIVDYLRKHLTSRLDCHSLLMKIASDVRLASKSKSDWRRIIAHLDALSTFYEALLNVYDGERTGRLSRDTPTAIQDFIECASVRVPRLRKIIDAVVRVDEIYELTDEDSEIYTSYVRHGMCKELDDLRAMYHGLPGLLKRVRDAELERVPRALRKRDFEDTAISMVYLPQVGFLVKCDGQLPETYVYELNYQRVFTRGDATFYEAECGKRLRDEIGDVLTAIVECQESVLAELRKEIVAHATLFRDIERCVSEIDAHVAFAEAAQTHALVRPTLVDDDSMYIEAGRHPLYESFIEHNFIPHDVSMSSDRERVVILTGPNGSGKTVVLQTVGLITFLAHIGSFVPAKRATIGLTDRIFSRVMALAPAKVDAESDIEECAFTYEINQMARMINNATGRSLCLIDEFGAATASQEGMCLLAAMIYHFATLKYPPRCFFTTHFREVCDASIVPHVEMIAHRRMRVVMKPPEQMNAAMRRGPESLNVVFLYAYEAGVSDDSLAIETCKLAGMPQEVLDRIKELKERDEAMKRGEEVPPLEPVGDPHREYKFRVCEALVNRYNACKANPTDENLDDFIEFFYSLHIDEYNDIKTDDAFLDPRFAE